MSTCPTCGAPLEGQWKFCLQCGTRVDSPTALVDAANASPVTPAATAAAPEIPGALRPDPEPAADARPLSTLALVALALGIIGGPVAIIFGHLATRQIRQTGERGLVLARVATILGYVWLAAWIAVIVWVVTSGVL
jgi:hypothetical protein